LNGRSHGERAAGERALIGFEGAVHSELSAPSAAGAGVRLRLHGMARGGRGGAAAEAEICFSDVRFAPAAAAMPPLLQQVRVRELEPVPAPHRIFRIDSSAGSFELQAAAVQVHRDAARELFGVLPPAPVPRAVRLGWWALLTLLRVPGAARLAAKLRG
jgi:hypothetical protein